MKTFIVQIEDAVAEKLAGLAAVRGVNVEYLIEAGASAIADELAEGDAFLDRIVWTPEDIAAIEEGIAQCERGETIPQEQVFAELRAKHGW